MPFPHPLLAMVLVAWLGSGATMWVIKTCNSDSSEVRDSHTLFTISQMVSHLSELKDELLPKTSADLIKSMKTANIDWNSCRIDGERILDGWGQPMNASYEISTSVWNFRSSGPDFKFGTTDDIEASMPKKSEGEQAPRSRH